MKKFEDYSIDFEFNEEATQLVFDPSFNENIKEKKVQLNSWKLSREDINHYATLVYKDYKSSYVTLSHQGEPLYVFTSPDSHTWLFGHILHQATSSALNLGMDTVILKKKHQISTIVKVR